METTIRASTDGDCVRLWLQGLPQREMLVEKELGAGWKEERRRVEDSLGRGGIVCLLFCCGWICSQSSVRKHAFFFLPEEAAKPSVFAPPHLHASAPQTVSTSVMFFHSAFYSLTNVIGCQIASCQNHWKELWGQQEKAQQLLIRESDVPVPPPLPSLLLCHFYCFFLRVTNLAHTSASIQEKLLRRSLLLNPFCYTPGENHRRVSLRRLAE